MNKNSYRGHQAHRRYGGAAKAPSGRQRPGQAAAVVECWEMWQELARVLKRLESSQNGNGGEVK
jgi:hypothetical protein